MRKYLAHKKTFMLGMAFCLIAYLGLLSALRLPLFAHDGNDFYTLQAMYWRQSRIDVGGPYAQGVEIAHYGDKWFVSFPPFPTVIMFLLTFLFGANTPSRLVSLGCFLLSYALGYAIAVKRGKSPARAACWGIFLVCGCNMMEFGLFGGVWNMAQTMGFALGLMAFYLCGEKSALKRGLGLAAIACAVGCRPFYALYAPFLMVMAWKGGEREGFWPKLKGYLPLLIAPAAIAGGYMAYNYARFQNVFEFGHNYLDEFIYASEGQFSLAYVGQNLKNILRMPYFEDGRLTFPMWGGFAFWLSNPIYVLFAAYIVYNAAKGSVGWADGLLIAGICANFFVLLMHKSFGGVQFGTRYLCDLLPAMYFAIMVLKRGFKRFWELPVMLWGVGFCMWGAYVFQNAMYG